MFQRKKEGFMWIIKVRQRFSLCKKPNGENFTRLRLNNHVTGSDLRKSPGNFSYTCARSVAWSVARKSLNSRRKMFKYIYLYGWFLTISVFIFIGLFSRPWTCRSELCNQLHVRCPTSFILYFRCEVVNKTCSLPFRWATIVYLQED